MNENVSAWLSAIDGLGEAHSRLKKIEVWNTDGVEFISKLDYEGSCIYADPPYLHETRVSTSAYKHEMSPEQHLKLLDVLSNIEGKFILSGYHSPLYDIFARAFGWSLLEVEIDNKASSKKKKEVKVECFWYNF
jgi:DNA adenine methylase